MVLDEYGPIDWHRVRSLRATLLRPKKATVVSTEPMFTPDLWSEEVIKVYRSGNLLYDMVVREIDREADMARSWNRRMNGYLVLTLLAMVAYIGWVLT